MAWLGPANPWPVHERKEAQRALGEARGQGWSLNPGSAHVFGRLRCPGHEDGACELAVFCSAKGDESGASTAKIIREKLRHCRNRQGTGRPVPVDDADAALSKAERLVEAAGRLRRSEELRSLSENRLDRAADAESADIANPLLDEAEAAEDRALRESNGARAEAFRFGLGEPWPPGDGAAELERVAREQLELARHGSSATSDPIEFEARVRYVEARLAEHA